MPYDNYMPVNHHNTIIEAYMDDTSNHDDRKRVSALGLWSGTIDIYCNTHFLQLLAVRPFNMGLPKPEAYGRGLDEFILSTTCLKISIIPLKEHVQGGGIA